MRNRVRVIRPPEIHFTMLFNHAPQLQSRVSQLRWFGRSDHRLSPRAHPNDPRGRRASTAWACMERRSWRNVGLGNPLKVRAQRQTHSTLQHSLSVQIVGYPKDETGSRQAKAVAAFVEGFVFRHLPRIQPLTRRRRHHQPIRPVASELL